MYNDTYRPSVKSPGSSRFIPVGGESVTALLNYNLQKVRTNVVHSELRFQPFADNFESRRTWDTPVSEIPISRSGSSKDGRSQTEEARIRGLQFDLFPTVNFNTEGYTRFGDDIASVIVSIAVKVWKKLSLAISSPKRVYPSVLKLTVGKRSNCRPARPSLPPFGCVQPSSKPSEKFGIAESGVAKADVVQRGRRQIRIDVQVNDVGPDLLQVVVQQSGYALAANRDQPAAARALHRRAVGIVVHPADSVVGADLVIDFEAEGALVGARTAERRNGVVHDPGVPASEETAAS